MEGNNNMSNRFKNKLRQSREAQRLSQTELAARAGVGVSVLNRIERWHFPVSERWARRVADALGREMVDVFPYLKARPEARL
jgi:ribosome-binding protein aMBF1 (putative translation factor)